MCVYMCVCVHDYACGRACMRVHACACVCMRVRKCVHLYMYLRTRVRGCRCGNTCPTT